MGADFLLCWCPLPMEANREPIYDWSVIESQVEARVDALVAKAVEDDMVGAFLEEFSIWPEDLPQGVDLVAMLKAAMLESAHEVVTAADTDYRDVTCGKFDDRLYLFTGCMSWGETTQSWDALARTEQMGLFEEPFEVAA